MDRLAIYLDSNVVIDTIEGRDNELMGLLFRSLYLGPYCYPFSAELVSEITDLERDERNQARLMYVEDLSKQVYFESSYTNIGFRHESPKEVFKTINEVNIGIDVNDVFSNVISFEQIKEMREAYGFDSSVLNNMTPRDAISHIDNVLAHFEYEVSEGAPAPPRSMKDMVAAVSSICNDHFKEVGKGLGEKAEHDSLRKDLVMYFSLLDSFGYWGDPKKKYIKGSRLGDAQHALVGSYFNAIVSRDTHFIRKSEAAYEYIGIQTKTYTTDEFKKHLEGIVPNDS
jgi:hypothetical protein